MPDPGFCSIEEALDDLRQGRMIVVVDDEHRENEGDLVVAAKRASPEAVNFMLTHGRGIVCLALSETICDRLHLHPQATVNNSRMGTAFTVKFDARQGIDTGTSAFDRARSIAVAVDPRSTASDLVRPGHMDGLRAQPGGVLVRAGHTEASTDLARLAGFQEAAVICEVLNADGRMARVPDLMRFCARHGLKICTIEDLIKHRRLREKLVQRQLHIKLPTRFGEFDCFAYTSLVDPEPHLALTMGGVGVETSGQVPVQDGPVLARVHSQCLTGDMLGSLLCDCGPQLHQALAQIAEAGKGALLYMRQEGRGIGLMQKLRAYKLQREEGLDTVEANARLGFGADLRHYGIGAQMLFDLGIRQLRLLTNNPAKVVGLDGYGLRIVERVKIQVPPNESNRRYLEAKREKLGHLLDPIDEG
ncbi:MAG: GTP cyclohydrolase II [Gemmataceae bacterium]|nr:GTP cyclohydrolase II [Gemmataceae bacterium]